MKELYEIYGTKKKIYLIPIMLFFGAVPFLVYANYQTVSTDGVNVTLIIGCFMTLLDIAAGFLFVYLYRLDPFAQIRHVAKRNPGLLAEIERDYECADELCMNVKRGEKYYHFLGKTNFLLVPIGQITGLRVTLEYSREWVMYRAIYVESPFGHTKVVASMLLQNHDIPVEVAKRLAAECGIVAEIKYEPEK